MAKSDETDIEALTDAAVAADHLAPPLAPAVRAQIAYDPGQRPASQLAFQRELGVELALATATRQPPDLTGGTEHGVLFLGSLPYFEWQFKGDPAPFRIPLDQAKVTELVEHWYRTEPGWRRVDEAVSATKLVSLKGRSPTAPSLEARSHEADVVYQMLRRAEADLAGRLGSYVLQAERLARREVIWRLMQTTRVVARELARFAPKSRYGRFESEDDLVDITPMSLAAELRDNPYQVDPSAPAFEELMAMLRNLAEARSWAALVAQQGAAGVVAEAAAAAQGIIDILAELPVSTLAIGVRDLSTQAGRELVAGVQSVADAFSGKQQTTVPLSPQGAGAAIKEALQLARGDNARAAQLYLLVQAATAAAFPLTRRMSTSRLDGRDSDAVAREIVSTAETVAKNGAKVRQELGPSLTSLKHLTDERPDVATGADKATRDAFVYPLAVYAALEAAALVPGSLAFAAASEVIRARGVASKLLEAWQEMNGAAGFASLAAKKLGQKLALPLAISSAALSVEEAIRRTSWHAETETAFLAVLEPSLRLIEDDPSMLEVYTAWGWVAVDIIFVLMEVAPLLATAAVA